MAKKSVEKMVGGDEDDVAEVAGPPAVDEIALPEGFVSIQATEADGWWHVVPGARIRGIFRGKFQGRGQNAQVKHFYQIELTEPTEIHVRGDANDWIEDLGEVGNVINLNASPGLRDLDTLIDDDSKLWEVCIMAKSKRPLKGGKTMWLFEVGKRDAPTPF